jgi:hypothetical protein
VTDITMLSGLSICTPDADELKSSSNAHRDPVARHRPFIRLLFEIMKTMLISSPAGSP